MQGDLDINSSAVTHQRKSSIKIQALSFLTYILFLTLLFAGISKIIDPTSLIQNLSSVFPFLPGMIVILISTLLPLIEVGIGLLLIFSLYNEKIKSKKKIVLLAAVALFGIFFLYSIYGFVTGNQADCGCFGNVVKSSFGWGMIVRNFVLLILSFVIFEKNKIA